MEEVGVSVVATKLADYLVDPTIQQLQYLFCVGKIIRNVEIKKKELILKQGKVQKRYEEAIQKPEGIDDEVHNWKNETESLIAEVERLVQQLRANSDCFYRWCPTWRRYQHCKMLAKTSQRMTELNTRGDQLEPFFHPLIVQDIGYHSSKNFLFFKSTELAFNELLEALQDDDNSMIGLWGMGGSGKTTLVKQVGKKAKELKLFDRVIIATVSQTPDIRKIQGEIADLLGLKFEEETEVGRARRIALRLQSPEERILIIFDDVWSTLNLENIGNPFGDEGPRNCKVLLTTRRQEVCSLMDCQETIPLGLLTKVEAWELFQTHAKVDDAVIKVAQQVVRECCGLPIAIVAMGKCLRRKGLDEVNVVLHSLRHSKPVDDNAFTCLKLSYDYLRSKKAKSLFLMCAMFPEDHEIIIEDLFRYGVGLGICKDADADSFELARNQVMVAINVLIDSSLLMSFVNFKNEKCVKMHDMVRDVALWIAREQHHTIMVNSTKELNELIVDEAVKDCFALSSWYDNNKNCQFPSRLDAPNLEFLLLHSSELLEISHATFEGTKGLKVLIIMCTNWFNKFELQPQSIQHCNSIQHLSNLRTLRLRNWNLHDISFVVSLTRLEILDLQGSGFARVPDGIEKLSKLRLLDLSSCRIDECCYEVIGRCLQLEELRVSMHWPHSKNEYLVGSIALKKLRRYELEIGECCRGVIFQNEGIRSLHLGQLNISMLSARIKDLAQRATTIQFYELQGGSTCFTPNIVQAIGGMNELTKLCFQRCSKIECITDKTTPHEDAVLHRLDELNIQNMGNLKQLCLGPSPFSLFQKLERLSIVGCPQLLHIFPADCNLGNLKFLNIFHCPMLTSIFPISTACTLLSLEKLKIGLCNKLKHVLAGEGGGDAWGNSRFPKLKMLSVNYCRKLEYAFPVFLVQKFEQLQHLSIQNAPWMKFVFGEEQPLHDADESQIVLPPLEYLHLQELPNLVGICSKKYCLRQSAVKEITCWNCPNMKLQEIRGHQLRNEEYNPLTAIESIALDNCGVESIFPYQTGIKEQIPTFQYLQQLTLKKCARLKVVFSTHTHQCLPKLTSVTISCCEELEAIFMGNEETQKNLPIVESCLLKLKSLEISECNKLKFILPFMIGATASMLSQLSTLKISYCSQMEEIFKCSNIEDHDIDSEREIKFLNMKYMELKHLPRLVNICHGFKLRTGKVCGVKVHECPKLMPIMNATIDWTKESLVRRYELKKYRQLTNNEALNLPLSVLIAGDLDTQSPKVEHKWRVIGDDEQEENNDTKMLRSEQQMLGGLVPTQVLCFQYLHSLEVAHIKKLKVLFSMGTIVQNSLPKLTSLTVFDCEELEEIIAENEEHQTKSNVQVGFPELRQLKVERCNKLKRLFSMSAATIGLSSLRKIKLRDLPNLISVCQALQLQVELISDINIFNCPKCLGSTLQQLATISLPQVSTEESNVQISSNAEQLPGNEGKGMKTLISRAEELRLENSMNLTSAWEGPTFIMFQNLKRLCVIKCRRLKCIFPSTLMRRLPCLKGLWIEECEELEEIMSSEKEEEHIHFPNESSNNSLCFPQLFTLKVKRCRTLKWLFPSLPSTQRFPKLHSLRIEECYQLKGLFNCKPEIQEEGFYNNLLPNLRGLTVQDWPMFQNLKELHVIKCRQLKCLLPSIVMKSLPCLSYLWIEECEELEEIMSSEEEEYNHFPNESSNNSFCFPQLYTLTVKRCRKLKWLFSSLPSTQHLPKLFSLTIEGCSQLKGVCNSEGEIQEQGLYNNLLPNLRSLTVEDCPIFSETTLAALQRRARREDECSIFALHESTSFQIQSWQRQNSEFDDDDDFDFCYY